MVIYCGACAVSVLPSPPPLALFPSYIHHVSWVRERGGWEKDRSGCKWRLSEVVCQDGGFNLNGSAGEDRGLRCLECVNLTPDGPDRHIGSYMTSVSCSALAAFSNQALCVWKKCPYS